MSCHITLICKSSFAALNSTFKQFPLMLKHVSGQVVLSSVTGVAVVYRTCERPLQSNTFNIKEIFCEELL